MKKKLTFSQRAKKIQKAYKRRAFDIIEKRDYQKEMDALIEEQEAYRKAHGMDQQQEQRPVDENRIKYQTGGFNDNPPNHLTYEEWINNQPLTPIYGDSLIRRNPYNTVSEWLNNGETVNNNSTSSNYDFSGNRLTYEDLMSMPATNLLDTNNIKNNNINLNYPTAGKMLRNLYNERTEKPFNMERSTYTEIPTNLNPVKSSGNFSIPIGYNDKKTTRDNDMIKPIESIKPEDINIGINPQKLSIDTTKRNSYIPPEIPESNWDKISPYIPSAISAGTNILGNLYLRDKDKEPERIIPRQYTPEKLNLTTERSQVEKDAATAKAINAANIRNYARNRGQAMSGLISGNTAADEAKSKTLTNIGTKEQTYNAEAENRARQFNMTSADRIDAYNRQREDAWKQRQLGYTGAAIGTIPKSMRDIDTIKAQEEKNLKLKNLDEKTLALLSKSGIRYTISTDKNGDRIIKVIPRETKTPTFSWEK